MVSEALLTLFVVFSLVTIDEAAVIEDLYDGRQSFGLSNELAYERRENEAIARLYENVLDVLQVRNNIIW